MNVIQKIVTLEEKDEPLIPYIMGDWHLGTPNFNSRSLKNKLEEIKKTDNSRLILIGDLAECIEIKDKRFSISSVDKSLYSRLGDLSVAQYEQIYDLLEPLQDKILCSTAGNHEAKIKTEYCHDVHLDLCRNLKIPSLGTSGFLNLKFDRSQFHTSNVTFFLTHGWVGGRQTGNKLNAIEALSANFNADIYAFGHSHQLFVSGKSYISVAGNGTKTKTKWFANTGSYLETYMDGGSCYAEKECLPPNMIGCVRFVITPTNGNVEIKGEI